MRKRAGAIFCALTVATASVVVPASAHHDPDHDGGPPAQYCAGAAQRSISPDPDGTFAGQPVFLGGFGFGSGPIWDTIGTSRPPASGILDPGIFSRVFVVAEDCDDPSTALVLGTIETQGYFVAYQQGPYGVHDMRLAVEDQTGIPARQVMLGGNHSHAGPDTLGVWGGVPEEYLAFIKDQTVGAVADAWNAARPATVTFGAADATGLLRNQFDYDPANQAMDTELRVLQALDRETDETIGTLLNLSAHTTVMGSSNTLVSADWTGPVGEGLADAYGGVGVPVIGAIGRSQPHDGPSYDACAGDQFCANEHYGGRVLAVAGQAVEDARPLRGDPVVDASSYYVADPAAHNALLLGLVVAGRPVGVPINRSFLPPWQAGNTIGTLTFSARVGDLLFSGGPGEMYPQITETVAETVPADGHFAFGLAGDMLGYIIAPFPDAYPEPIRRSFFDEGDPHTDPTTWEPDPISNDNYFFNVSHTLGERVTCSMLRGAGDVFGEGLAFWQSRPQCLALGNDAAFPPGADTLFPSIPAGF